MTPSGRHGRRGDTQALMNLDLEELSRELRDQMRLKGEKSDKRLLKRIEVVRTSATAATSQVDDPHRDSGHPARFRPMVQLDGGRFATSTSTTFIAG